MFSSGRFTHHSPSTWYTMSRDGGKLFIASVSREGHLTQNEEIVASDVSGFDVKSMRRESKRSAGWNTPSVSRAARVGR